MTESTPKCRLAPTTENDRWRERDEQLRRAHAAATELWQTVRVMRTRNDNTDARLMTRAEFFSYQISSALTEAENG